MRILPSFILILATTFSLTAESADNAKMLVNASLEVESFEVRSQVIMPTPGLPEGDQTLFVRKIFRVAATLEYCRKITADDFILDIVEKEGVNYLSLYIERHFDDCFGPTRKQVVYYDIGNNIDTELPFVQISPASLADNSL